MGNVLCIKIKASYYGAKKLIRVISFAPQMEHTGPLFKELGALNISNIDMFTKCNFIYKCGSRLNNCNWFQFHYNEYNTRMVNNQSLVVNNARSEHSRRSLMYRGVKYWNTVPLDIRLSLSYSEFKLKLKW